MMKRYLSLILILTLLLLPDALAARKAKIRFPVKIGMMYVDDTISVPTKVSGVKRSSLLWETSNPSVVKVNGNALTGVSEGLAMVRASGGGARAVCGVVVLPRSISLSVGQSYALPSHSILQYASANGRIATIDRSGRVTAIAPGETKVGVKYDKVIGVVKVTVSGGQAASQSKAAELDCASQTDQIVLVEHQRGSKAEVSFHEKIDGVWTQVYSTQGYVGANGIGKTREGDKKTPTGTFNLPVAFGIQADPGANVPYLKVTKYHYWCGTSGSKYYNQLVDERTTGRKAASTDEKLINYKGYYDYCLFIDYNAKGEAGKGSCIFLHCIGSKKSTAGCIAIPKKAMKQAVKWVRPGAKIVIR